MIESIRELVKYRELLYMIAWRDVRIKYKQSAMGIAWAVLMPIIIVSAGILVKYGLALVSHKPINLSDIGTVSVKAIPWAFFIASIRFSTSSLVGNANLVTKIYFPRAVFPIASILSQLFDSAIAACFLAAMLLVMQIGISINILFVPVLLALLVLLATGIGILLSAMNLFFRDVKYVVEVVLTFAIFFTPVFYDASMFGKWEELLLLNPVAPILEGLSSCVILHHMPEMQWLLYSALVSTSIFVLSFPIFQRLEPLFAERV
jgi:ABC-type polysaccharide/polyol phosphate export permease